MNIRLENINKSFNGKPVLQDISLEIKSGCFLVILGPSGCGKTTLLRIISGLEKPDSGKVFFNDVNVTDLAPKDRNIGYVFQNYSLYPNMKVRDIIAYPLKIRKYEKIKIIKKVKEIAGFLKIDKILDRYPEKLSGGEAQRVSIARAMIKEPNIYMYDEPLSNIDAIHRKEIRNRIKTIQNQTNKSSIYVTHDQKEAKYLGDKLCLLNVGVIQQIGSYKELIASPNNSFVSNFVNEIE